MLGMSFLFAFKFGQTYACTEIYKSHGKILKCCVQEILNLIYFPLSEIFKEEIILNVCKLNSLDKRGKMSLCCLKDQFLFYMRIYSNKMVPLSCLIK